MQLAVIELFNEANNWTKWAIDQSSLAVDYATTVDLF
jgi:hypothetical protein